MRLGGRARRGYRPTSGVGTDIGVNMSYTESVDNNVENSYPYASDLMLIYTGDIESKTDGYYFIDSSGNGNDGKIIGSPALAFVGNNDFINISSISDTLWMTDNKINVFNFLVKFTNIADANDRILFYMGGEGVAIYQKGLSVSLINGKLRAYIANGVAQNVFTVAYDVPDNTNFHLLTITVDLLTRKLTITLGILTETFDITLTGGNYNRNTGSTTTIGRYTGGCDMTMIYCNYTKDGVYAFDFICEYNIDQKLINRATGAILTDSPVFSGAVAASVQDVYPSHVLNGFQVYMQDISPFTKINIHAKTDYTLASPIITGYTKLFDYPKGVGYNYASANIYVNESLTLSSLSLQQNQANAFYKYDNGIMNNILYYTTAKSQSEALQILTYLNPTFTAIRTVVNIGDSIANGGGYPLVAELPAEYLTDQPLAKIFDLATNTIQTLTKDNSDQVATPNSFSHLLAFAKSHNDTIYLTGKGSGGSTLTVSWKVSPEATFVTEVKNAIGYTFMQMIKDGYYPNFEFYCSLGHNDAALGGMSKAIFKAALITFIAMWRSFVNQNSEWHHLPCRRTGGMKTEIAVACDEIAEVDAKVFVYNPELLTLELDGVHPDSVGAIEEGIMFETKNHL